MNHRRTQYFCFLLLPFSAQIGSEEPGTNDTSLIHDGRHLVEMSYSYLDGFDGEEHEYSMGQVGKVLQGDAIYTTTI